MSKHALTFPRLILGALALVLLISSCSSEKREIGQEEKAEIPLQQGPLLMPSWAINANIYEVNVRQYTPEGTLQAFATHLPRLKEMGVDILWFMPVQPIGKEKRKGSMGSYYSISDYVAINPEFGTMDDFKAVVKQAHDLGMYVILDWVANHTAFDHVWAKEHPDWYIRQADTIRHAYDNDGKPTDWYDVADLNYDNAGMRQAMIESMQFWLREADIDGFRCDVAGFVPTDFWGAARKALDEVKPVFMLSEWEYEPEHFNVCFNMNYGWHFHHILNELAAGKKNAASIDSFLIHQDTTFPEHYFQMHFTSNHDENSWKGTAGKRMGAAEDALTVLAFTLTGMPLLYSGQESGETKQLAFFEKDQIEWGNFSRAAFYEKLLKLKKENKALWNGPFGGKVRRINAGNEVYAFERQKDGDAVVVAVNLTNQAQLVELNTHYHAIVDVVSGKSYDIHEGEVFNLPPNGYLILSGKEYTGGHH
jgi:glycosidase